MRLGLLVAAVACFGFSPFAQAAPTVALAQAVLNDCRATFPGQDNICNMAAIVLATSDLSPENCIATAKQNGFSGPDVEKICKHYYE